MPRLRSRPKADKRRAWRETGAIAVDLESVVVARAAAALGIPFVVLRAIADPAARELPPAALVPLTGTGTPALRQVLASVLARPRQLPSLLTVAREARQALQALVGPAHALNRSARQGLIVGGGGQYAIAFATWLEKTYSAGRWWSRAGFPGAISPTVLMPRSAPRGSFFHGRFTVSTTALAS